VIDRAVAFSPQDEMDAQFLALVYADEELLRAEFDAIIAAGWACARPRRSRHSAGAPPSPVRQTTSAGREGRTTRLWIPTVDAWGRQRSPPPTSEQLHMGKDDEAST
jgi:hypothetical protein